MSIENAEAGKSAVSAATDCSPLVAILYQRGAYDVVWEIARWMETDLADSHREDVASHLRKCAEELKQVANRMLMPI